VQDIVNKSVYRQPHFLAKSTTPASNTLEDAIYHLKERLKETTSTLQECINTLADEHRQSRKWKAQYERGRQSLVELEHLRNADDEKKGEFLAKRQGLVNVLLPIARPSYAEHSSWKMGHNTHDFAAVFDQNLQDAMATEKNYTGEQDIKKYKLDRDVKDQSQMEEPIRVYIPQSSPSCISTTKQPFQAVQL
jgi:hypothetical protein